MAASGGSSGADQTEARARRDERNEHGGCEARYHRPIDCLSDFWRNRNCVSGSKAFFGTEKTSVRMVLGVASLPMGMPVEFEVMLEGAE